MYIEKSSHVDCDLETHIFSGDISRARKYEQLFGEERMNGTDAVCDLGLVSLMQYVIWA